MVNLTFTSRDYRKSARTDTDIASYRLGKNVLWEENKDFCSNN